MSEDTTQPCPFPEEQQRAPGHNQAGPGLKPAVRVSHRPRACRNYIRRHLAAAWPDIVTAVLDHAKKGSVSHTTVAAKLAGLDFSAEPRPEPKLRQKSFAKQLIEELDELEKKNIAEFGPL